MSSNDPNGSASGGEPTLESRPRPPLRTYLVVAVYLAAFWAVLSGKFDAIHIGFGLLSLILVMYLCRGLIAAPETPGFAASIGMVRPFPKLAYGFWLLWQIAAANLQVAKIILSPSLPIDPVLIRFRTGMKSPVALVVLGNSITLTPGTFTLRIDEDVFLVHAIHEDLAAGLLDGSMQRKVARLFDETLDDDMQATVMRDAAMLRREGVL